jgi:hypothetical protein
VSNVKRFSPLVLAAVAVAAAIAWARSSQVDEADEDWTPVQPS